MSRFHTLLSLRNLVVADAATCAAMGLSLVLFASPLAQLTRIPSGLLFYVGLVLFPIAAFMAIVAIRSFIHPTPARLIIGGNLLWVGGSILLLAGGWIAPNVFGIAFIIVQALAVAVLTKLEHGALRGLVPRPQTS